MKISGFKFNIYIVFIMFISISTITIGYSALNTELNISGEAMVNVGDDIFISNITLISSNESTESFSPEYTQSTTNIGMNVPSVGSTFTYEVTITNTTDKYYYLKKIEQLAFSNSGEYYIYDLYLYDEFAPYSETKFQISYEVDSVPSNINFVLELEYIFGLGERYKDPILNGADPELIDGLIPIVYDDSIDKWVKADVLNNKWYDYSVQQWANATSVINSMRDFYVDAEPGEIVEMSHMTSMMVWIPRYSYTLQDEYGYLGFGGDPLTRATPGAYDIIFHDEAVSYNGTAKYVGSFPTEYYTSPAFCWGNSCDDSETRSNAENLEIPGFWMAKFEASRTGNLLYSKPSTTPMINYSISQTFYYVQNLMNGLNGYYNYGFIGYVDAHLIKNTEWGAMAYLSQSAYGKYGNVLYTGVNKEIYPNNCTNYSTGIGGDNPQAKNTTATCGVNTYDTYYGMGASTTGNIYGVYDTVGGTFDRVMGSILSPTGEFYPERSGFTSLPEAKYINLYPHANYSLTTTPSIMGDALTDTLGFYDDRGVTAEYLTYHWFYRGGSLWSGLTDINGIFSYTTYSGTADPNHSSRYTITIY